jgi:hypothetical protein
MDTYSRSCCRWSARMLEFSLKVAVCVRTRDHRNSYNHGDTNLAYGLVTWTKSYSAGEQRQAITEEFPPNCSPHLPNASFVSVNLSFTLMSTYCRWCYVQCCKANHTVYITMYNNGRIKESLEISEPFIFVTYQQIDCRGRNTFP